MRYAQLRFATSVCAIAGGALLAVGAFSFGQATESWIGLGVGSGLLIITVTAFATAGRGGFQRSLDLLLAPICIWTLVSARTIELAGHGASPSLVKWLGLAAGAAIFAIGVVELLAHELSVEADLRWALAQLTESDDVVDVTADPAVEPEPAAAEAPAANGRPAMWLTQVPDDEDSWQPPRTAGA